MKNKYLFIILSFAVSAASGQPFHLGLFGGLAAYNGDLAEKIFPKKGTHPAIGITGNYELKDQIILRAGITYGVVGGADRYSNQSDLRLRNLSFQTSITEFSMVGEYYLLNLYNRRYSPYAFAGLAIYHFNPYAFDVNNQKVFLKPLSTEGEGLAGYPGSKPYSLTQVAIPIGGGIKFAINDDLRVGVELGVRKLFTDYLDDVSTNYVDQNDLQLAKGQKAVDMSYRSPEVGGPPAYPVKNAQRGSPKSKDYYYFSGIHFTYRLKGNGGSGHKIRTGCPANPN